jgi:diguanylate cyclase (GGDEF)-like protein
MTGPLAARALVAADRMTVAGAVVAWVGTAVAWALASALGSVTSFHAQGPAAVYLPVGVVVAAMVRWPAFRWAMAVGIVTGELAVAAVTAGSGAAAVVSGAANTVEVLVVAMVLVRLDARLFERGRDALALIVAGVVGVGLGAVLGAAGQWLLDRADPMEVVRAWFAADLLGIVILVPMLCVVRPQRVSARRVLGFVALLVVAIGLATFAAGDTLADGGFTTFLAWYALLLIVLVAGVRFGVVALGVVQVPAVIAAFASVSGPTAQQWLFRQGIAVILGLSMLWVALVLREQAQRRLRSEQLATDMFELSPIPTACVRVRSAAVDGAPGIELELVRANVAWSRMLAVPDTTVAGSDLLRPVDPADRPVVRAALMPEAPAGEPVDVTMVRRGGEAITVQLAAVPVRATWRPGQRPEWIIVAEDVSAQRRTEHLLEREARTDSLTGLLNRAAVVRELEARLDGIARPGERTAVLFVDLDGFKAVNDGWGHLAGDDVLREVAVRLARVVRPRDVIGRLGGDEFLVIADVDQDGGLDTLARRIEAELDVPAVAQGRYLPCAATVGRDTARPGESVDDVLARADADMYRRKAMRTFHTRPHGG